MFIRVDIRIKFVRNRTLLLEMGPFIIGCCAGEGVVFPTETGGDARLLTLDGGLTQLLCVWWSTELTVGLLEIIVVVFVVDCCVGCCEVGWRCCVG